MITLIREPSIIFLKDFWCAMFASQLLRLIGERKSWGLLCSMQGRAENSCNYCFLNQKDDPRLLWLWKLLIKLRRSGRRHFCIAKSSFKDLDHKISETRIWGVLTSTPVTLSFTLSMKVARNAGSLLQTSSWPRMFSFWSITAPAQWFDAEIWWENQNAETWSESI